MRREGIAMRDPKKLRAFELADGLALKIYRYSARFPKEEMFGLTSQMRRAGVSIASNIVEGCGRESRADYLRFLDMAFASAQELHYQISLAGRLGYLSEEAIQDLEPHSNETCRVLNGLIRSVRYP
jgi:four helix bundle protein